MAGMTLACVLQYFAVLQSTAFCQILLRISCHLSFYVPSKCFQAAFVLEAETYKSIGSSKHLWSTGKVLTTSLQALLDTTVGLPSASPGRHVLLVEHPASPSE